MIGLEFLQKIGEILQNSLSSEETYSAVFDILDGVIEFDAATLFVVNSTTEQLEVVESRGEQRVDLASEVPFSKGGGLSGWVASQREPVILSSMGADGGARGFRSFVSVPLWSGDKLEGVLNLGHGEPGFYQQDIRADLVKLGVQLSLIIEQLRLRADVRAKNDLLEAALEELRSTQSVLVEKERLAATAQLVVAINHEINNPLAIIISLIDLLTVKSERDLPEIHASLIKMRAAAFRIDEVTKRLESLESTDVEEYMEGVKMLKLR
ncbi:MAG: GAF domain-containing protein [Candidatus Marinimicrobia bacterium]|nr:GAF domain-containing protein [Candidatus Neomarinimicrobiota bacterium]